MRKKECRRFYALVLFSMQAYPLFARKRIIAPNGKLNSLSKHSYIRRGISDVLAYRKIASDAGSACRRHMHTANRIIHVPRFCNVSFFAVPGKSAGMAIFEHDDGIHHISTKADPYPVNRSAEISCRLYPSQPNLVKQQCVRDQAISCRMIVPGSVMRPRPILRPGQITLFAPSLTPSPTMAPSLSCLVSISSPLTIIWLFSPSCR